MIAHIFADRCTGCEAGISACPTHVFDPGPDGVPVIARLDQCQTCFMCELYCDADAIYVAPDQRRPEDVDVTAIVSSGELAACVAAIAGTMGLAIRETSTSSGASARSCAKAQRLPRGVITTAIAGRRAAELRIP
jgi:NAD-dependent dihydropyrimidine dehydrogenase PreA subunit